MRHEAEWHTGGDMSKTGLIELFTKERYVLEGYIRAIVRDPHLAEDVYQNVAVEVLENLDRFDPSRDFRSWVRGIARNKAKQELSRHSRLKRAQNTVLDQLVEKAYDEMDEKSWDVLSQYQVYVGRCAKRLSGTARKIVHLRYQSSLSLKAIAERLDKSAGAIQVALSRARHALLQCVERYLSGGLQEEGGT
jgi:RNA polymerase sigma-70 factor (ECF subfamily)